MKSNKEYMDSEPGQSEMLPKSTKSDTFQVHFRGILLGKPPKWSYQMLFSIQKYI